MARSRSFSTTAISIAGWAIKQIALPLTLDRRYSFDNFISDQSDLIVANLRALVEGEGEAQVGLWGGEGHGKTHLLNASADFARARGVMLQIYDARQLLQYRAEDVGEFESCDVLAIDNLDAVAGNPGWEAFFYQAINRCRDGEFRLLYAMSARPGDLRVELDDLRSRLQWGLLMQLPPVGDDELRKILRGRARLLGFELPDEVISYLMHRYARDLPAQMRILRRLDGASLSQQRRVTIPLVRKALQET